MGVDSKYQDVVDNNIRHGVVSYLPTEKIIILSLEFFKNSPVDQHAYSTGTRTGFVSHVVVSHNEDEDSSLGQRGTVRHLYPDEVEV